MTQIKPTQGQTTPRFADIATFFRLPIIKDLSKLDYCICGIPWDGGTTNRPGGGWGSDFTPFTSRNIFPYRVQDPTDNSWHWMVTFPTQSQSSSVKTSMDSLYNNGIIFINAATPPPIAKASQLNPETTAPARADDKDIKAPTAAAPASFKASNNTLTAAISSFLNFFGPLPGSLPCLPFMNW